MRLGRRGALRFGAGLVTLLGGCSGRVSETEVGEGTTAPPTVTARRRTATDRQRTATRRATETGRETPPDRQTETEAAGTESGSVEEGQTTERQNAVTQTSPQNTPLAERTGNVVAEIEWFIEEYPEAMDRLQSAMRRVEQRSRDLSEATEITLGKVRQLETNVESGVAEVEAAVAPHFGIHNLIRKRTQTHTGTALRFVRRGDTDRVREELRRLADYAEGFTSDIFVEDSLPRHPINNVLVRMLRRGEYQPSQPFLFQVRHVESGFTAYAYETHPDSPGPYTLGGSAVSDRATDSVLRTYAPLRVGRSRQDELLVAFTEGDAAQRRVFGSSSPQVGTNQTIHIQQYRSKRAAENAATLAFARVGLDQFRDEPTEVGDSTWERVYYRAGGDVQYVYFTRAGRHLLATGAGRTAWEERVDWDRVHDRTWLAGG